ncbi:hypothetical protein LX32DRAFT_162445 [Colletotrichum zoysiae]|uniref:Uncharacterized protein n=1 Tax=Colletotrichum zoysiae TaxID=1216348 RepID=A0AAD9H6R5_9PEZI|nr:hypothetical protein LX32DRAFT_162445 [Colletotrichum zoysiae]
MALYACVGAYLFLPHLSIHFSVDSLGQTKRSSRSIIQSSIYTDTVAHRRIRTDGRTDTEVQTDTDPLDVQLAMRSPCTDTVPSIGQASLSINLGLARKIFCIACLPAVQLSSLSGLLPPRATQALAAATYRTRPHHLSIQVSTVLYCTVLYCTLPSRRLLCRANVGRMLPPWPFCQYPRFRSQRYIPR